MDIRFAASQSVEIIVPEQPVPIAHYLRQPQRVVNALAASSRIELLNDDRFRLTMRPLSFMSLSIQPTVDMKVWADSNAAINVRSIGCEIRGVEYINQRFSLNLVGQLYSTQLGQTTYLKGKADLDVQVELPPPFWMTPKFLLERAGNGLLLSVLSTIKQRLLHQLLLDYRNWATSQSETETAQGGIVFPINHPAS